MEDFLKPFLNTGVAYLSPKIPTDASDNAEAGIVKLLQKIIFKHDVVLELKDVLNSIFSGEPFSVKSNAIRKIIERLNVLLLSDEDTETKVSIFRWVFLSFASYCRGDESVHAMHFFAVLSHVLGMNSVPDVNGTDDCKSAVNEENFKTAFDVDVLPLSQESFLIFKDLLHNLSKTVILNSSETQAHFKWLQQLMKNIAHYRPFLNIFLEIFLISADIDFKLLEGNLEHIFTNVLAQESALKENFSDEYAVFLERTLNTCSKFQRSIKFVTKLLSSIKVTPTVLKKEVVLPSNVINEFSKTVAAASNQHSLLLFGVLLESLKECFHLISENVSGCELLLVFATSQLLVGFLKEVKLFAPNIASTTLRSFLDKLNIFKEALQDFGSFLFENKSFILKNEDVVKTFLELCFYCGEIGMLVDCYKDSVLQSDSDCNWQCCLSSEQWSKIVRFVLKSKLKTCDSICVQLALQKLRARKLIKEFSAAEESTLKILMHELGAELDKFDIIQELPPEDLPILMDELTVKQTKTFTESLLKQALQIEKSVAWLSHPAVQENSVFVTSLFSAILRETGSLLQDKTRWLLDECFDAENVIRAEVMQSLPEKINFLLRNLKKTRKFWSKNSDRKDSLASIVKLFKLLPLPHMGSDFKKLGLSFAVGTAVVLANDETTALLALVSVYNFVTADTDASTCFDVGLCLRWLSELSYEDKSVDNVRVMVIESLVRNAPKMQFGLQQVGEMINSPEVLQHASPLKRLESRVVLYNELGKCWQRAKKRKSDNDLIGSYRTKLAKMISDEAQKLENNDINPENSRLLLKIFAIELIKAIKTNEESEIIKLTEQKLPSYFDYAVKNLKKNYDEAAVTFLTILLQSTGQLRKYLAQNSLLKMWRALKTHEKVNWRLFSSHSSDEEFNEILADLLKMSKKFLTSESDKHSSNCFEIWVSFFEFGSKSKRNSCQLRLQEFFNYTHDCSLQLRDLLMRKKIFLTKFLSFCVGKKEVVVTSDVLDTIIHVMLETIDDSSSSSTEDFHELFVAEVDVASAILLKQFAWSKSKVHLLYIIFQRLLGSLMAKCSAVEQTNNDDILRLSDCALSLEKWVSIIIKKEKDFARISAYFITSLISSIASVTVVPAIKIHMTNCINHFLSISDSHTVAYLMRVLRPGYQQVFITLHNQFKKYHKYSGKI